MIIIETFEPGCQPRLWPIPSIGLGTFITLDLLPGAQRDHLLEVTRRFWAAGGRVFDTSPLYGMAEVNVGQFASVLGINDKMFVSNKVWATGEYLADDRQAEESLRLSRERLWRDKIDLMRMIIIETFEPGCRPRQWPIPSSGLDSS